MKVLRLGQSLNTISNGIIRNKNFEFTVNTATAGSTTSTQFQLPLISNGAISMDVDWGDGTTDTITTWNQAETLHTYSVSGIYDIKITNEVIGWQFNDGGDKDKMTNVSNCGELNLADSSAFYGCSNMTWTAIDSPVISSTSLYSTFRDCSLFNGAIGNWDVSSVLVMSHIVRNCSLFNQPIGNWDVSNVTTMNNLLNGCANFNQTLNNWNIRNVTDMSSVMTGVTLSATNYDALLVGWEGQRGDELITEGTFPNDYTPAYGSGVWQTSVSGNSDWSISGGKANKVAGAVNVGIQEDSIFDSGKSYNVSFTISNRTAGSLATYRGQGTQHFGSTSNNGDISFNIKATGGNSSTNINSKLLINGSDVFDGSISNVTVKRIASTGLSPHFGNSAYSLGSAAETAHDSLTAATPDGFGWTITDGGGVVGDNAFTFSVDTSISGSTTSTQFQLPLVSSGAIDMYVDWGDGSAIDNITTYNQAETLHTYSTSGVYTIKIGQEVRGWRFDDGGDKAKITNVSNCGELNITNDKSFNGCSNMTWTAIDAPTISSGTLQGTFKECTLFNGYINNWDVSSVSNFVTLFSNCTSFNQPLNSWNTSSVVAMTYVFNGCTSFNQPLNNWNTSSATDIQDMFRDCSSFNQDLNSWDTSSVVIMSNIFRGCTIFNGNITSWNTSSATSMGAMFYQASAFNQNLNSWDVSLVTTLQSIFNNASSFNQPLNNWNTSSVTNMTQVFRSGIFDQDISSWNIRNVTDMTNIMKDSELSTANYNALLVGWEGQRGVEQVTNGDFTTDSDWAKGTGWSISGGKATYDGLSGTQNISQTFATSLVGGDTYILTIEVMSNEGTGTNVIYLGDDRISETHLSVGTHILTHTVSATTTIILIYGRSGEVFKVGNISVKRIAAEGLTPNFGNSKYPSDLSTGGVAKASLTAATPTGFGWLIVDGGTV